MTDTPAFHPITSTFALTFLSIVQLVDGMQTGKARRYDGKFLYTFNKQRVVGRMDGQPQ